MPCRLPFPPIAAATRLATICLALAACARGDAAATNAASTGDAVVTGTAAGDVAPGPPTRGSTRQAPATTGPARDDAAAILALLPDDGDPAARAARAALADDASWRATAALAPALADARRRTAATLLLAAAAAAQRDEWPTVDRLVSGGAVPDAATAGFASLLQARSALARGAGAPLAREALAAARRAAATAPDAAERGVRLALAARALDRLAGVAEDDATRPDSLGAGAAAARIATARGLADSGRAAYAAAAALMPSIADWLTLRAAAVTRDSAARARSLAALRGPAARERVAATEADARERGGDRAGAAAAYAAMGRRVKAASLRIADAAAATDPARRASELAAARQTLVRLVTDQSGTSDARAAVDLLDRTFAPLAPAEELAVARSANASGPPARAVAAFERAFAAGLGAPRDRQGYATLLGRTGRPRDAAAEFARVRAAGGALAGSAAYQRGRMLLRAGDAVGARTALQEVPAAFPADTAAASSALYLLADLAVDDGRDADARSTLLALARRYPTSEWAARARFDAAIIALAGGDAAAAAKELDALRPPPADTMPDEIAHAAMYWAGRATAATGDPAGARTRWQDAARRVPASYYAMLAARRLGAAPWAPTAGAAATSASSDVVGATVRRMALLERIGFDPEVQWEREWLTRWADSSADRQLAVARALRDAGATSAGMRLARRALDRGGAPTAAAYRALYPWPWEALVRQSAEARSLDPTLAAAVIRQESNFTPGAVSAAGAVGLMQLMPPVGRSLWDALGTQRADIPWSPALLRQPDVSVALGVRHLATAMAQYPDPSFALAAYNAGGTPVARWRKRPGADDPELFVERIPYDETRDYVRIVTRNRAFYAALYRSDPVVKP